jgi:cbb3-type cytochrome oxidase subunit 3
MKVFSDLFSDMTGLLTIGIIVFMLVMMAYLFSMFISKSSKGE